MIKVILVPESGVVESQYDFGKRWASEDWPNKWNFGYGLPGEDSLPGEYAAGYAAGMFWVALQLLNRGNK